MAKETVRYPDALVARIEAFVTDSTAFESKSEYHRFASEFLLSLLDPGHEPSVLGYAEIFEDLEAELDDALDEPTDDEERFLETYIRVRRHLLHGEPEAARAVVDETYDVTDREALLLDELVGQSHRVEQEPATVGGFERYTDRAGPSEAANGRTPGNESEEPSEAETKRVEREAEARPLDETPIESEH